MAMSIKNLQWNAKSEATSQSVPGLAPGAALDRLKAVKETDTDNPVPASGDPANLPGEITTQLGTILMDLMANGEPGPGAAAPVAETNSVDGSKKGGMAQSDQEAAESIRKMIQLYDSRPEPMTGPGVITQFHQQAIDQQIMVEDMRGAQAIQRQTTLAQSSKDGKLTNPQTKAALAQLGDRPIGAFTRQAAAQQSQILSGTPRPNPDGEKEPKKANPVAETKKQPMLT
ncbi:MAG: hypothetical protein KF760_04770 [Candidatus Eremiobacteraeota bacterium]|nr:hypothetical protein [Candidatus Eremiobacteraeota bacterium]MCW5866987.1 hypothetical protein [Candidatus Eremiobacteraeota bacterium]